MKEELSNEDIQVLFFLSRYIMIKVEDCQLIYKTKRYYRERINKLIKNGYVKRYKTHILLDRKGRKRLGENKAKYLKNIDNKSFMDRLKNIVSIATISINSKILFIPSWEIKPKDKYTETSRRYIGLLVIEDKKYLCYYLSAMKDYIYIKQLMFDIKKSNYDDLIIFMDNYDNICKKYLNFALNKNNTYIIKNTRENKEFLKNISKINVHEIIENIYNQNAYLSDWKLADYMLENEKYIIYMPFINTEKVQQINWHYSINEEYERTIEILTLEENVNKLNEIINKKCHIRTLNKSLLGGICEK